MKKLIVLSLLFTLIIGASGCGSQKTSYTKEFPYLPSIDGMKEVIPTPTDNNPTNTPTAAAVKEPTRVPVKKPTSVSDKTTPIKLKEAVYTIENKKWGDVLKDYEKVLNKDGWKTVTDNKPTSIGMEKDNHKAALTVVKDNGKIKLFIWSE